MKYRPEIDGLRAIAVTLVVLYHAELVLLGSNWFKAGFLGVDIFFVISGYLISKIILEELDRTSRFSIFQFYERRARRILPALLVVVIATSLGGVFLLLPSALLELGGSVFSSMFFYSNFFFYIHTSEYGADSSLLKPLLHTWSLSVEEQFYIFFPLLALFVARLRSENARFFVFIFVAACSLMAAQIYASENSSFNFYSPISRAWELLSGVLITLHERSTIYQRSRLLRNAMPALGLVAIIYSLYLFVVPRKHPGLLTALPVLGTCLIIAFSDGRDLLGRLLSTRMFVAVGLISYSLYLWHFPVLAFLRIANPVWSNTVAIYGIAASLILTIFSYKFVEQPYRSPKKVDKKALGHHIGAGALIIICLGMIVFVSRGEVVVRGLDDDLLSQYDFDNQRLRGESWRLARSDKNGFDDGARLRILIVGNSHAKDTFNALYTNRTLFPGAQFAYYRIQLNCFAVADAQERNQFFLGDLYSNADVILISTRYRRRGPCVRDAGDRAPDLEGLQPLIERSKSDKKEVVVTDNTVEYPEIEGEIISDHVVREFIASGKDDFSEAIRDANEKMFLLRFGGREYIHDINRDVRELAREAGALFLSKSEISCDLVKKQCFGILAGGQKALFDYGHYTMAGAEFFGRRMSELGWLDPLNAGSPEH